MIEAEVKLPVQNLFAIREKLVTLGFEKKHVLCEEDHYFDQENGKIRRGGKALRIRKTTDMDSGKQAVCITFKGIKLDQISMSRKELETEIGSEEVCREILEELDYREVPPAVIKRREELCVRKGYRERKFDMNACLDQVEGLGEFLELECMVEEEKSRQEALGEISRVLAYLGYTMEQTVTTSYLSLLQNEED